MRITLKFFGSFKSFAGVDETVMEVDPGTSIDQLARRLNRKFKGISFESLHTAFMVNDKICGRDQVLAEGDQVRVFQMLAGG